MWAGAFALEHVAKILRHAGVRSEHFDTREVRDAVKRQLDTSGPTYCAIDVAIGAMCRTRWANHDGDDEMKIEDGGSASAIHRALGFNAARVFTEAALPKFLAFVDAVKDHYEVANGEILLRYIDLASDAAFCTAEKKLGFEFEPKSAPTLAPTTHELTWHAAADGALAFCIGAASTPVDDYVQATAAALAVHDGTTFLYHGTTRHRAKQIVSHGIIVPGPTYSKVMPDFGAAFYLGFDLRDALAWAFATRNVDGVEPALLIYRVPEERRLDGSDPAVKVLRTDVQVAVGVDKWSLFVSFSRRDVHGIGCYIGERSGVSSPREPMMQKLRKELEAYSVIVGPVALAGADGTFRHPRASTTKMQCALKTDDEARLWDTCLHMTVMYCTRP